MCYICPWSTCFYIMLGEKPCMQWLLPSTETLLALLRKAWMVECCCKQLDFPPSWGHDAITP